MRFSGVAANVAAMRGPSAGAHWYSVSRASDADQPAMLALVAERVGDGIGEPHLERERIAILRRFAAGGQHGDLRGAPCQRREPDVETHGRDVVNFQRDDARRKSLAAPRRVRDGVAAVLGMQQQARVASARLRVRRQQRLDPRGEIGHRRIGIRKRARRTHGRARAATDAQMRFDRDVIAVGTNRERRTDIDALRATGLARPAVRAQRRLVFEEFRLLEFAGQRGELGDRLGLRQRVGARPEIALRRLVLARTTASCAGRGRDRSARSAPCLCARSRSHRRRPHATTHARWLLQRSRSIW